MATEASPMKLVLLPNRARLASNAAVRRIIAMVLMFAIRGTVTASGFADELASLDPTPIEGKVNSIGLGQHVAVRLKSGQTIRGCITAIGASSFTLSPHSRKPDRVVPYDRIAEVRTKRSFLPWIIAAVVAGAVAVIAINHAPPAHPHGR